MFIVMKSNFHAIIFEHHQFLFNFGKEYVSHRGIRRLEDFFMLVFSPYGLLVWRPKVTKVVRLLFIQHISQ